MPPASVDPPQTPESKGAGGLRGVFKSLTGGTQSTKTLPTHTLAPVSSQSTTDSLSKVTSSPGGIHGGSADNEKLFEQLKFGKTLADRKSAADGLRLALEGYPLSGVASIWYAGKDLIDHKNPAEVRHSGFQLLTACIQHGSSTDSERKEYFDTLTSRLEPEDFHLQLASVIELAKQGKDLSGFHYEAIPLLTRWLRRSWDILEEARRQSRNKSGGQSGKGPLGEDTNLHDLFKFIVDVIKFSSVVSSEEETAQLIDGVLYIALNARSSDEILACVRVLDSIVIYNSIPGDRLCECIKVLCSIYCVVPDAKDVTWRTIRNLCKSHNGHTTVSILLDLLRNPPNETLTPGNIREIRGALSVLEKIMSKDGRNSWPVVPFAFLMDSLSTLLSIEHAKVESEILRLILSLFNDDSSPISDNIMGEDWGTMFEIAAKCSLRIPETSDGRRVDKSASRGLSPAPTASTSTSANDTPSNVATSMAQMLNWLILRIESLIISSPPDFLQRANCVSFFARVNAHLPETCSKLVIEHYVEYRLCYPSEPDWKDNVQTLLDAFFSNRSRPSSVRLLALKAITDVFEMFEMMDEDEDAGSSYNFVSNILSDLIEERDVTVLREVVSFAVSVADTAEPALFDYIIKQIHSSMSSEQLYSPPSPSALRLGRKSQHSSTSTIDARVQNTPSYVLTRGLVQIFMRTMEVSSSKALIAFDEVLWVAKSNNIDADARLSAMKMLCRLRADWANRIFLTPFTESEALAASLYRTQSSLASKQAADEAPATRSSRMTDESYASRTSRSSSSTQTQQNLSGPISRNTSGINRNVVRVHPLWMTPDPDALPEVASGKASMLLVSVLDETEDASISASRRPLKINVWLDTVISLLQQGCDWEVYSYLLVHMPSQLTNQALFKGALPQIKHLRETICQQIKNSSFYEPPANSGLRRTDVSICLFHVLNMITSYHQRFQRSEEDEIVQAFIAGVNAWDKAAKPCIHALSICCHELPNSMRLVLVNILQKMSQIITQSHVAVHILEFLATLARIPDLYSHFRDEDYRIVFGICFRYLQYVREKAQDTKMTGNRHSNPPARTTPPIDMSRSVADSPTNDNVNIADDLPQYVYALAYHVITFWFLSLPLADRASQVTWITKNLVWTDPTGRQNLDEQAQVTMNFLQRTAYADVDESAADPNFTEDRFGEILKKRWLIGHSIVTIEQATRGGWAQITKRQPSGTSHYVIREKFERPPAHQVVNTPEAKRDTSNTNTNANVVHPSHLLVQLAAPSPLTQDMTRPIPLPDDDIIRRAISSFDRIPTVDCHKVGVIYVGENQTEEVEILSNVMGSSDYTEFLSGIGTLTKLQGATFNAAGLDRQYNTDGEYTFCWRDRVTEIVFHVTTLMPTNLDHDPQCTNKKRHIGNDFVNIIFNNSGQPFRFDTFPSQFNYVNIIITPESRASFVATRLRGDSYTDHAFYKVQVMSKEGFPEISPAAETKIVSLKALPGFVRVLALNASVFSHVWADRAHGEHISSWRNRLRDIVRLREKYGSKQAHANSTVSPPSTAYSSNGGVPSESSSRSVRDSMASLRRSSVATFLTSASDDRGSKHFSTADTEIGSASHDDGVVDSLDFSKWA